MRSWREEADLAVDRLASRRGGDRGRDDRGVTARFGPRSAAELEALEERQEQRLQQQEERLDGQEERLEDREDRRD